MLFRYLHLQIWFTAGVFTKSLFKGSYTTTWLWSLHSESHDFETQFYSSDAIRDRKILSANLSHVALVLLWITALSFHAVYFSNYTLWLLDPKHVICTAQYVWFIIGQDYLNIDSGSYHEGLRITSGIFSLYRSLGIINITFLKCSVIISAIGALATILAAYIHIHVVLSISSLYNKFKSLSLHQLFILFGLGSVLFSGHVIHISLPVNYLLDLGADSWIIELVYHDLLSLSSYKSISSDFRYSPLINTLIFLPKGVILLGSSFHMIN